MMQNEELNSLEEREGQNLLGIINYDVPRTTHKDDCKLNETNRAILYIQINKYIYIL